MKRVKYIIIGAISVISIASCTKQSIYDEQVPQPASTEITFRASTSEMATKVDSDGQWERNDRVSITVGYQNGASYFLSRVHKEFNVNDHLGNMTAISQSDPISARTDAGQDYYAVYPYSAITSTTPFEDGSFLFDVDFANVMAGDGSINIKNEDFLVAQSLDDDDIAIDLMFEHQLAKIEIEFIPGGKNVTSVRNATTTVSGAPLKGKFHLKNRTFSNTQKAACPILTDYVSETKLQKAVLYVIPHTSSAGNEMVFTIRVNNEDHSWSPDVNTVFEKGKSYKYTVMVGDVAASVNGYVYQNLTSNLYYYSPTRLGDNSSRRELGAIVEIVSPAEPVTVRVAGINQQTPSFWDVLPSTESVETYDVDDPMANMRKALQFVIANNSYELDDLSVLFHIYRLNSGSSDIPTNAEMQSAINNVYISGAKEVWYLPAKNELEEVAQDIVDGRLNSLDRYPSMWYWSSTTYDNGLTEGVHACYTVSYGDDRRLHNSPIYKDCNGNRAMPMIVVDLDIN